MINIMILGLLAVLCSIGFAVLFKRRTQFRGTGSVRLANIAEGTHGSSNITKLTDAAITGRYKVVKFGSDAAHVAIIAAATDVPLGICSDEASGAELPVNVGVFGGSVGTKKVLLGGTVAAGDELSSSNGTAIKLPTATGTYYPFGRALAAGVSGETIEFQPGLPVARVVP
jgi:hypothetical protein